MVKTMTVMVVARGGRKKDRFHLLRDLWEIMGVLVLLLGKENICRDLAFFPKQNPVYMMNCKINGTVHIYFLKNSQVTGLKGCSFCSKIKSE